MMLGPPCRSGTPILVTLLVVYLLGRLLLVPIQAAAIVVRARLSMRWHAAGLLMLNEMQHGLHAM
jgi:hypothetical protein